MPPYRNAADRFWEKVDKTGSCWLWMGYRQKRGYGVFGAESRQLVLAHRWAYEATKGNILPGFELDHLCRNTSCVNPDHLEPVSHQENVRRGRLFLLKTHCPHGHPYDEANTYWIDGRRRCRSCIRIARRSQPESFRVKARLRQRAYQQRRKARFGFVSAAGDVLPLA